MNKERPLLVISSIILLFITLIYFDNTRGAKRILSKKTTPATGDTTSAAEEPDKTSKWAVIIGINNYENMVALSYAVSDVTLVYNTLIDEKLGGFKKENVTLLTDDTPQNPTRTNILRGLRDMIRNGEGGTILFYYAGHGIEQGGLSYLMPCDVDVSLPEDKGIALFTIKEMLSRAKAKSKVVILDACHSGESTALAGSSGMGDNYENFIRAPIPNTVILASTSKNQEAYEDAEQGHGIFTHYLATGLNGAADTNKDGKVTAEELFPYVRDNVKKWVFENKSATQTPVITSSASESVLLSFTKVEGVIDVVDSEKPRITILLPQRTREDTSELNVEAEKHEVRVAGTVSDNVGVFQVSIDEEMVPLTSSFESNLPQAEVKQGEMFFSKIIQLPTDTSVRTIVIRAADKDGNVATEQITFRVPLLPELIPQTVYVPAGDFLMGSNDGRPNERPQRQVKLSAYEIGVYEVMNAQFAAFVSAMRYTTTAERKGGSAVYRGNEATFVEGASWQHPKGPDSTIEGCINHPVVHVSFDDAVAYCKWLSARTGRNYHLPTEAQWEYAARGSNGRTYPWGEDINPGKANYMQSNRQTTAVGSYEQGKSEIGCFDTAGNVREWCLDWYTMRPSERGNAEPIGPSEGEYKVVKGGSWHSPAGLLRCAYRGEEEPEYTSNELGFRVALSP